MEKKAKMIKIGNTSFRVDLPSVMKYRDFKSTYEKVLRGIDIDKAWIDLGGKLPKKGG